MDVGDDRRLLRPLVHPQEGLIEPLADVADEQEVVVGQLPSSQLRLRDLFKPLQGSLQAQEAASRWFVEEPLLLQPLPVHPGEVPEPSI